MADDWKCNRQSPIGAEHIRRSIPRLDHGMRMYSVRSTEYSPSEIIPIPRSISYRPSFLSRGRVSLRDRTCQGHEMRHGGFLELTAILWKSLRLHRVRSTEDSVLTESVPVLRTTITALSNEHLHPAQRRCHGELRIENWVLGYSGRSSRTHTRSLVPTIRSGNKMSSSVPRAQGRRSLARATPW